MKRWIPILIIAVGMIAIFSTGFWKSLNYETLRYHHIEMTEYVNNNPIMTPFMYIGSYIVITALSIPGALLFSLVGGFLFNQPFAFLYVMIGATIGATLLFLAAKTSIGNFLKKKAGPRLAKMEAGFNENAASYMLFLRFIPLFPYWLVNLAPAFFNVRLRTYLWTTALGIAPGAFVTTQAGRGLGMIFEQSDSLTLGAIFNTQMIIALVGLGIVSLIPIFFKKLKSKKR